jgi:hypothetical protein
MYTRGKRFILLVVASTTAGCCLRVHVSNHRLIPDFILSSL